MNFIKIYKKSVKDLFSMKTIYSMLLDALAVFLLLLSTALVLFVLTKPYHALTSTMGPIVSLALSSTQLQEQIASNINVLGSLLSHFIDSIIRATLLGVILFSAVVGFTNQLIWSHLKDEIFELGAFWPFGLCTCILVIFWTSTILLSTWLLQFKAALVVVFISLILSFHSFQMIFANIQRGKKTWPSIYFALKKASTKINFLGVATMFVSYWIILVFAALFFQAIPVAYAIFFCLSLLVYLQWTRNFFLLSSEVKR
ncbi:MAG: hypothetical protein ACE5DM_04630 [Candidatus Nanoarchaeia archaeon]